jgi:hypothetical protein
MDVHFFRLETAWEKSVLGIPELIFRGIPRCHVTPLAMSDLDVEYLYCTLRHNAKGEVSCVRFLLKAKPEYQSFKRYFVAVGAHRAGGESELIEFYQLDRAYDDQNARRFAAMRGHEAEPEEYNGVYLARIDDAVRKFFWLSDRFVPESLEELTAGTDMNLDGADTISELNLSQCSGDTEFDTRDKVWETLEGALGLKEVEKGLNDEETDKYHDVQCELGSTVMNQEITYRMLVSKYPEQEDELKTRRLKLWTELTTELRAHFAPSL